MPKRGDAGVRFSDVLRSGPGGDPVPIGDNPVSFIMRQQGVDDPHTVTGEATVVNPAATDPSDDNCGAVFYISVAGDLDVAGDFLQEWEVTSPEGPNTYPSERHNTVRVIQDLG